MKKQIPNLLTLGNLFCGTIATILAVQSDFVTAGLFVVIGIFLDFFDGFVARLLKVSGELGKQLDSLADMVTSGVVPGIIMFNLLYQSSFKNLDTQLVDSGIPPNTIIMSNDYISSWVPYIGLLLTLGAGYRLAKFNIDTRQSESFIGLPTPAMSLFVISLPLIQEYATNVWVQSLISNNYFLIAVTLVLTYLMNAEIPLFSLKFKEYSLKNNSLKYFFLATSLALLIILNFISVPIIIIVYVLLSVAQELYNRK
ncbi:MAG: CDP-diacylglycerol--serine O-phosphatidyltransferase [Polaribacter sp.]|jgi:CDP-diacylglycerol--serine O-phosphatidyltransferase